MTSTSLRGQTVVITGGTGGLARALAPALLQRGAKVALLDLDPVVVKELATSLGPPNLARGWAADVRSTARLRQVMDEVAAHFGSVDIVMANAVMAGPGRPLMDVEPEQLAGFIDVNLVGVFRTFSAAMPHVQKSKGYLLATASMASFVHGAMQGSYPAAKAAIWALCDTLRLEMAHLGVAVGSLHPTFFKTPLTERALKAAPGGNVWGNQEKKGTVGMVPIEVVVEETIRGMEARAAHIFAPRKLRFAAYLPFLAQALIERQVFSGKAVREAIAVARRENGAPQLSQPAVPQPLPPAASGHVRS